MDPLSLTASIIAIVQLTTSLVAYLNDVRDATSDQKKVAIEAGHLLVLLTSLRYRLEEAHTKDDEWFNQVKSLGVENGPLQEFKNILEKLAGQITSPVTSRTRDRVKVALTWKFTKPDVDAALMRIERLKSLIQIALSNDAFKLSQTIHSQITDLTISTQQAHVDATHEKIQRWLKLPDPSVNYNAALQKRHSGTGSWLVMGRPFVEWKASTSALLWLHAGCGKTVLSATALEHITGAVAPQRDAIVGYFYFDFNDVEKQQSKNAVRSLLLQLSLQLPDGLRTLDEMYQKCDHGQKQPIDDIVRSVLDNVLSQAKQTYIVLDALDECQDRDDLLALVEDLAKPRICVLATSRRERDIDESLRPIADHIINIQSALVDIDIDAYIRYRLKSDKKLKKWPIPVQNEIVDELMKKADGMFRWAYCQIEALRPCVKLSALREMLSSLPRTLDETYTRILKDIESNDYLTDAITVLRWLCFSKRPLRLSEVIDVLAITNGVFNPEERLPDPQDIMRICSSLISCIDVKNSGDHDYYNDYNEYDEHDDLGHSLDSSSQKEEDTRNGSTFQVRLAHFSVKEYLLSERCVLKLDFQPDGCHAVIAENCIHYIQYLSQESTLSHGTLDDYPLARYTAEYWWQHARGDNEVHRTNTIDLACSLLETKNDRLTWTRLYSIDRPWETPDLDRTRTSSINPLYYAACIGVPQVVERLLLNGADVNTQGGGLYGSALQAASAGGHDKIVQILLDAGADVNAQGRGLYGNALYTASEGGHDKIVRILLDAGADVNAQGGGLYGNALQVVSASGHDKIVQILLNAGADVNAQGGLYGNALQVVSASGHDKVVQILLDAGADVNAQGGGLYGNALQAASLFGHDKIVQMLLDAGAVQPAEVTYGDISSQSGDDDWATTDRI